MTYPEVIRYLNSFINYEKTPSRPYKSIFDLKRFKNFLRQIGNPQTNLRCIHIAGTKGKGSTCSYIAYILRQAGYKTGLYTSPHLSDFRERIRILKPVNKTKNSQLTKNEFEGMIPAEKLADLVRKLKNEINNFNKKSKNGELTFFEVCTALAFMYFLEQKVDFVVFETGMGGRLDATNTVSPLICAITPISYEHTKCLGNTLAKIAREKAGIIKAHKCISAGANKLIVISAPQEKEAMEVIRERSRETGAKLFEVGREILFDKVASQAQGEIFNVFGRFSEYPRLKIPLIGYHQIINSTVAVAVAESLQDFGIIVPIDKIREGLSESSWPGRFEIISQRPLIILDGAQNRASAHALKNTLKERFPKKDIILIFGVCEDKDIKGIFDELLPLSKKIILTRADNPRAANSEFILRSARSLASSSGNKFIATSNVAEALDLARKGSHRQNPIIITGSLFVVAEARKICLS